MKPTSQSLSDYYCKTFGVFIPIDMFHIVGVYDNSAVIINCTFDKVTIMTSVELTNGDIAIDSYTDSYTIRTYILDDLKKY